LLLAARALWEREAGDAEDMQSATSKTLKGTIVKKFSMFSYSIMLDYTQTISSQIVRAHQMPWL